MENRLSFCQFYFQCLQDYWLYWSVESHCDYVFQWPIYQHFSKLVGAMWTKMLAKLKEYFLGWLHNCVISSAINWLIRSKLLLWGCNIWNFIQKYFFFSKKLAQLVRNMCKACVYTGIGIVRWNEFVIVSYLQQWLSLMRFLPPSTWQFVCSGIKLIFHFKLILWKNLNLFSFVRESS